MIEIKNRWTKEVIRSVDADTLQSANLRGAYLQSADLQSANLRGADLQSAYLQSAYLQSADLQSADLQSADLQSAKINWQSHILIAELLRRDAREDIEKRKVAGLILMSTDMCWDDFLRLESPLRQWAL